ncbi:insulin-like peptide INSL5 [Bombina bombina]|uniref:insulin-like peptide INSL5 n=1 Tax=Bombina bombina TaxID=8345 RepID=UPI00235B0223|nr:insulin-like peptide INSL5 [Bombina bombina]
MKAVPVCLALIFLIGTVVDGDGQFVKLCGREFIRAVIYTCGGSRWRRHLSEQPQNVPDRGDFFTLYTGGIEMAEPLEYQLQKTNSQTDEVLHQSESTGELWNTENNSGEERRDLNELLTTACCKNGCKKKDLSSLC